MSRNTIKVVIKRQPDFLIDLGSDALAKHTADGASSIIPDDIADDLATVLPLADAANKVQKQAYLVSEAETEKCNLLTGLSLTQNSRTEGTLYFYILSARDILLGLYRGKERNLGNWGFTVNSPNNVASVVIVESNPKLVSLAGKIIAKHLADGLASPLPDDIMTPMQTLHTAAVTSLKKVKTLRSNAETATQERDNLLGISKKQNTQTEGTLLFILSSLRDYLLGRFRSREQQLGNWGFTVNMSGPAAKTTPSAAKSKQPAAKTTTPPPPPATEATPPAEEVTPPAEEATPPTT